MRSDSPPKGRVGFLGPRGLLVTVDGGGSALSLVLGAGKSSFGSSVNCDYLLSGTDAPVAFSLFAAPGGGFAVEAYVALTVNGVGMSSGETRSGLRVAAIAFERTVVSVQFSRRSLGNRAAIAVAGALVVAAPFTYGLGLHASVAPKYVDGRALTGQSPELAGKIAAVRPANGELAVDAMREYLSLLGYAVTLREDGQGRLRVSGQVLPEQRPLLMQALKGLRPNERFVWDIGGEAPAPAQTLASEPKAAPLPKVDIVSVILRPQPMAVTKGGRRLVAGAQLNGGWTIKRIGLDAIDVENGSQTHRLVF